MDGAGAGGDRSGRSGRTFSFERSIRTSGAGLGVAPDDAVFGRHSDTRHDVEDEEALKWAALERLPTYHRLRTSILTNVSESGRKTFVQEVDVRNLGLAERNQLIDKLLKIPHDDNEVFLQKLRARLDKVGIQLPTTQVRYEHLSVSGTTAIAGRHLPTLPNTVLNILEGGLEKIGISISKKAVLPILNDVSGIVKPSRLTLLLGPPGSGKTTLLLALAARLSPELKVKGRVSYNGYDFIEFVPQKTSAYIGQNDLHMAEMTVRETLDFSARCQGVGTRYEMLSELLQREKEAGILPEPDIDMYMKATAIEGVRSSLATDYTLKILGLDICADIPVGDSLQRGISGGQRKRLTTGEMIVGPTKTLFMDEISTGLDSSTTFQIVKCLRQFVHVLEGTILMSLLQPAPETYDLFDDIILLSEGQIVYQGPRESVLPFFEECGFRCPERKGVADFLQEVTSTKDQEQYWSDKQRPYQYVTVRHFVEKFKQFHVGLQLAAELAKSVDKSEGHPAALVFNEYGLSKSGILRANWEKEWLLMKRNLFVYVFKGVLIGIIAVVAGTVFVHNRIRTRNPQDGQFALLALFFGHLVLMFNAFAELSLTLVRLPVIFKQRDILLYPAWAYAIPSIVLKIPISLLEAFVFTVITYFLVGFTPEASRFFKQLLVFFLEHWMATSLFRAIATLSRSFVVAMTGGSMSLLLVLMLGGFIIPRPKIPPWWIWAYWSSPLSYVQTAISVNEMLAPRWMKNITLATGETRLLGVYTLESRGLFSKSYWYWISVGALVGFIVLLNIVYIIGLTYLNPLNKPQAIISKEQLAQKLAEAKGEDHEPLKAQDSKKMSRSGSSAIKGNGAGYELTTMEKAAFKRPSLNAADGDDALEAAEGLAPKRGMILPFTALAMSFENISYSVDMPAAMKAQGVREDRLQLLHSVSGAFRPGVLTALVGISGAGKTTLMDVLAGRKTGGYVEGDIRISGFPKRQETFARISGYCEQFDIHSPQVTVYESLVYSAWLRLSTEIDSHTRKEFVEEVMELVELTPLRDGLVGLPGVSGLSTEQRKRLTIAVELVANPSIIFMDEPTSGLDARAAAIVMRTVRNTVDTGRTVVCTIHQPSIDIFESFDELLLLKRGGQVIYAGPLGHHSHKLIEYFQAIPGVPKMEDGINPATWMLEISSAAAEARLGVDFADIYQNSSLSKRTKEMVKALSAPREDAKDLEFATQYSQPFHVQLRACLWKQLWSYWRSPGYNLVRFTFTFAASILFGTIFWQKGTKIDKQLDLFNAMGILYGATMFLGINNSATVQPVVAVERTVFYRELGAGLYSPLAYALAQVLIEFPFVLFQSSYYSLISYSMIGFFWEPAKFFWYMYFATCSFLYFTYYGMMFVAITPNAQVAAIMASSFYAIFNLFSGFVIPRTRIPGWWIWYYWINPVEWTVTGLITTQYGDLDRDVQLASGGLAPIKAWLKDYFGYRTSFLPVAAVVIILFPTFFATIFVVATKRLNFQRR